MKKVLLGWICFVLVASALTPVASETGEAVAHSLDSDGDGITDRREYELGLDPTSPDTDGDRIGDGLERRDGGRRYDLAGSDPARKDLFVSVYVLADQHPYREQQQRAVLDARAAFATMPIDNPDGSEGVTLHVTVEYVDRRAGAVATADTGTPGRIELQDLRATFPRRGPEHVLVVTSAEYVDGYAGEGALGGRYAVVGVASEHAVVHELLHNVVGRRLPATRCGSVHTCEGYLGDGRTTALSDPARRAIERWGFATELTGPSRR